MFAGHWLENAVRVGMEQRQLLEGVGVWAERVWRM